MKTNFERGQLNAQDDLNDNFKEIDGFMKKSFKEAFGSGTALGTTTGSSVLIPMGPSLGYAEAGMKDRSPYVLNANGTFTMTRDATLIVNIAIQITGTDSSTTGSDYAYVDFKHDSTQTRIFSVGDTTNLRLDQSGTGFTVVALKNGQTCSVVVSTRDKKTITNVRFIAGYIEEFI
ncbi:hypothetical protein [Enterococcus sp. DIV1283b]|uniref:hypothetical protein n=1 Tax=Enterococcus sp. DIV1283b TaxID=2774745 RepID=UPI003F254E74